MTSGNEEVVMKTINCEARLLPDGHLLLPPEVAEKIKTKPNYDNKRRIIILNSDEKTGSNRLSRFCGKWKDDRDADEIIADIMAGRRSNVRSDKINL